MPGVEGEEPGEEQMANVRRKAADQFSELGLENFYARDMARLATDDVYVKRFFMHVFDMPGEQEDEAVKMIISSFKWRKEFGVENVSLENVNKAFFEKGALYARNRDKDGKLLFIFEVRKHYKGTEKMEDLKNFFVWYLERIDREERGDKITIVFDCANCGLKNMDMEFIQFIIGCFRDYYPFMLNYILVFEMPWVLNAAWKIIKAWLPAAGVKLIKFLTKSNLSEYVDEENALEAWGGSDTWQYSLEDELAAAAASSQPLQNGHNVEDNRKKSVTFAEINPSHSEESLASLNSVGSPSKHSIESILRLVPGDEIVFSRSGAGDLVAKVQVVGLSPRVTAYKIKTTSPEKYRVRPSSGVLSPGAAATIEIHVAAASVANAASLVRDKFLITVIYVEQEELSQKQLTDALKSSKPEAQYRLRCALAAEDPLTPSTQSKIPLAAQTITPEKQLEGLVKKVIELRQQNQDLAAQVTSNYRIHTLLLVLIMCWLLVLLWRTADNRHIPLHCSPVPQTPTSSEEKLDL